MNIINAIKRAGGNLLLKGKKHSPEICLTIGIGAGIAGLYFACKETLSASTIIDEAKDQMELVKSNAPVEGEPVKKYENHKTGEIEDYTEEVVKHDKFIIYIQTLEKLAKNYAPAAILFLISLIFILGGFKFLKGRYITMTAAFAGLQQQFKDYRKNIFDKFGKKADLDALIGARSEIITEENIDEKGNMTVKESEKHTMNPPKDDSNYIFCYSEETAGYTTWQNCSSSNLSFLRMCETMATNKLRSRGHLFLNEVYDMLGLPHTKTGSLCGWHTDHGDDYVSFTILNLGLDGYLSTTPDYDGTAYYDLVNDNAFVIQTNCCGTIYDKI